MRAGACQQRQSNSVARVLPGNELAGDGMALVPVAPVHELTADGTSTIICKFISSTSLHSMWCVLRLEFMHAFTHSAGFGT